MTPTQLFIDLMFLYARIRFSLCFDQIASSLKFSGINLIIMMNSKHQSMKYINISSIFQIEIIVQEHFKSLPQVSCLNLNNNMLRTIKNYTLTALTNLWGLTANANKITVLEHHAFYGLHRLQYLRLERNYIMEINLGDLPSGVLIRLHENRIAGEGGFLGLPQNSLDIFESNIDRGRSR